LPSGILVNTYKLIPMLAEEALSHAKLEREIEIAREVQERLFPQTLPKAERVEMAAHCRPAHAVGGDYYDLISICDGSPAQAGDASGENIPFASANRQCAHQAPINGADQLFSDTCLSTR
jgi:serine phosphatase RsbU (regulator of sigma subunit)